MSAERQKSAAQITVARKPAALKAAANKAKLSTTLIAANEAHITEAALVADTPLRQHDDHHSHGARAPPVRLFDKNDILSITHVTFPTIWSWMRAGTFPRSRVVGGKSMWRSDEVRTWLDALPVRPLKGDDEAKGE